MKTMLTILLISLCASLVLADEKPDYGPFVPQLEGRAVLTGILTEGVIFSRFEGGPPYDDVRYAPGCDLPMNQETQDFAYYTWLIEVTNSEPVGFEVTTFPSDDSILAIFCDFDPMNPTAGMISFNDDTPAGDSGWSYIDPAAGVVLTPGEQYTLVVTSYVPSVFGEVVVSTTEGCNVATVETKLGAVKSLYR